MIFRNRPWASIVVLLMGAVTARAQTDFQPQARAIVTSFMDQKFAKVEAQFNPALRTEWSQTKLLGVWLTLNAQFGDFKSIEKTEQKDAQTVIVTCRFSETKWQILVVFDSKSRVSHFLLPLKKKEAPGSPAKKA